MSAALPNKLMVGSKRASTPWVEIIPSESSKRLPIIMSPTKFIVIGKDVLPWSISIVSDDQPLWPVSSSTTSSTE